MARYEHEFMGIPADLEYSRGADPNYRGGVYRGQRMRGEPGQAAYGWHRWRHAEELAGEGGFRGRSALPRRYAEDYDRAGGRARPGYDWEYRGGGGVRDVRRDPEFMRDFNANSSLFRGEGARHDRYGEEYRERGGHPIDRDTRFRFQYANRGLSSSGYSQPWVWGPMRGNNR